MSIGAGWLRQAERAAATQAGQTLDAAERELGGFLPGAGIKRGGQEIRIAGRGLMRRWIAEPALRFLSWRLK